jgi:hypothetical protein
VIGVYSIAALVGFIALVAWLLLGGGAEPGSKWDPESRVGPKGRRAIAASMGFGLAGLSAEFSPRDLTWPIALVLAIVGAVAMVLITDRLAIGAEEETD